MSKKRYLTFSIFALLMLFVLAQRKLLYAQAAPGPIIANPPSNVGQSSPSGGPAAQPTEEEPRTSIVGDWKLNRDESDSGQRRAVGRAQDRRNGGNGPYGGNRPGGPNGRRGGTG